MIPQAVHAPVADFVQEVTSAVPGRVAGVYLVGGAALGDFSARQSNVDLVVVCDPPLEPAEVARVAVAERRLERAGRRPAVWYAGWDEIAEGPSGDPGLRAALDTPMTRALLQEDAVACAGPDWPVVAFDEEEYRQWCRRSLEELVERSGGLMVMRRDVSPLVLQAARLAIGAESGRVVSKSAAGDSALSLVPQHFRRILHDAAGYRNGATTSMYWGPFERKYDARQLLHRLVEAVTV